MTSKHRKTIVWAVIISESSHVFCCVLPTFFSLISLLSGAGLVSVMPGFMVDLHEMLHHYELPMIAFSFVVLCLGWVLHFYSRKIDCHDHGCGHKPCGPQKDKVHMLMIGATILFLLNVSVYFFIHRGLDGGAMSSAVVHEHHADHDHDHDHSDHD